MYNLKTIEDYKQPTSAKLEVGEGKKQKKKKRKSCSLLR